jgi:hypothetical protein
MLISCGQLEGMPTSRIKKKSLPVPRQLSMRYILCSRAMLIDEQIRDNTTEEVRMQTAASALIDYH